MWVAVYSLPAGHKLIEILSDPKKLPLYIASDIVSAKPACLRIIFFPDTTYLERWEFPGFHPSVAPKVFPVRQPVVAPLTDSVRVYGEEVPLNVGDHSGRRPSRKRLSCQRGPGGDLVLKNTTLCDTVGGSAVFYNSRSNW